MKTNISASSTILTILFLFIFLSLPFPSLSELCNKHDKKVLLQIKQSFNNPYLLSSWFPDRDCCTDWYAVECDLKTNRITSLTLLKDQNLTGTIPSQVGDLPFLKILTFHKLPNLTGNIPSSITKLTNLQQLTLSWDGLSGSIPSFLGKIKSLQFLDLSFNQFTGSIPSSLSLLPNIAALHLDRNKLTGKIPDSFGKFVGTTPDLYLSHNNLTGTVPKSLGSENFTTVDFSRNKLEGDVSFLFGANKSVQIVFLSRNTFMFDITNVVFPASLTSLDLNHNKIFGSLPVGLTGLNLQFLNVSYNRLCGQIPTGGDLQSFTSFEYFHNKCLCGAPLPAC